MENYDAFPQRNRSWDEQIEICIENSVMLPRDSSEAALHAELRSESMRFLRKFLELARDMALAKGLQPADDESERLIGMAHDVATTIIYAYIGLPFSDTERRALDADEVTRRLRLTYPADPQGLLDEISEHGRLAVGIDGFESGVKNYLESPFRNTEIDRTLLIALTDWEITAFIGQMEMDNPFTYPSGSPASIARTNPWHVWIKGRLSGIGVWTYSS